ncbi:MAG: histidine kinase dimerization/phospho-acceptor domain-containing protein [Bacteroidota bacterium]
MEKQTSIASAQIDYKLLAHLSHDVRSPFNGLIGFSDLLASHFDELSDDRKKEYASLIRQLSRKSFFQLQLFSTWIKLISNNLHLNVTTTEFRDILDQSIEFCSNDLETKNIHIMDEQHLSFRFHADTNLLTTAIFAILSTAILVMGTNEELRIQTANDDKQVTLNITGKYADTEIVEDDPFHLTLIENNEYTESSSKLWIAKQIILKHHGELFFPQQQNSSLFEIQILLPAEHPHKG